MKSKATLFFSFLLVLFLGGSGAAAPQKQDEFRVHLDKAAKFYDAEQYEDAIKELQTAYAIRQLPRLLLNLGQAYRKLGRAKDALGFYEFYLRVESNPKPEVKQELQSFITQTRAMLEAAEHMKAQQEKDETTRAREKAAEEQARKEAEARDRGEKVPSKQVVKPPVLTPPPGTPDRAAPGPVIVAEAPKRTSRPIYKKWWFWTAIGTVAAGAVVTGAVLGTRAGDPDIVIRDQKF